MSDSTATVVGDALCVLVVGDSESADDATDALAAGLGGAAVLRERTVADALDRLADRRVHCLVCPFAADRTAPSDATLERLAARTDERPIVAVTAGVDADRALEIGATDVVDRDASPAVVAARVRNAAEREHYRTAASRADRSHRSILEHAAAVVWVLDADGEIEYASPAVEAQFGYTPAELERTSLPGLVHPDDRETARDVLASVAAAPLGTSERATLRLGRSDGTWRVAALTCTNRLADPTVEGIVVTVTAESDAASTAPGESDGVRAAADRLGNPFFALGQRDEIRYANPAAMRLFAGPGPDDDGGSSTVDAPDGPADLTGTVVWALLPDSVAETVYERVREAQTTGSVVEFEVPDPADGRASPLAVSVHPARDGDDGVSVYAREQPTDATSPVRDRLDLLESVVDALDDGVAVLEDDGEGESENGGETIRLANPALLELADADALVGRGLDAVFDDDLAAAIRERARSPVVRWMDPVTGDLVTDGDAGTDGAARIPVDVFVAPLSDPDRTLCVVRDRRDSAAAALSILSRAVTALRGVETPAAVRETVVDAVRDYVAADVAAWYVADDRLRPAAVTVADRIADGESGIDLPSIDPEGTPLVDPTERSERAERGEPTVYDGAALAGALVRAGLRAERVLAVPIGERGVVLATSTEPMAFEGVDLEPVAALSDAATGALDGLERAADLRSCRRDRSRLATVADRTTRLWAAERSFFDADTRDAVERRLCEAVLSLSPLESDAELELAWCGRVDDGRETITPAAWAGRDGEFLESLSVPLGETDAPTGIAAATSESVDIADLDDLAFDEPGRPAEDDRAWRRRALERGFRSVLCVPIASGGVRHGTLTVYADRPSAFDDRTERACEHLAGIAGAAIGTIETTRALLADGITELEVALRDETEPLSAIARRLGRRIDVRSVIPRSSGGSTVFCTVSETDSDAVRDAIESLSAVESIASVSPTNGETALELVLTDDTVARAVADAGGVLRSLAPVDDRARLTIELGTPVAVRSFVRALERTYPGTELVARRERDRPLRSTRPKPFDDLAAHLSERQRRTLEAAYYGGFFEWPRERTGEEVAESLGVSQPTFSRHLRLAQRKLFALLFDETQD
ncbi:bacterio-opsin activator domain-containing protein [Natrinema salifodinae]|uniref:PAS domain S-box-containing protein n=1 Tax=Natrinema salifodinae TaxID=1202768 RepID=A0A1I0M3F6_9EURY|nr:bacterio-opsin activator domain-containing protein [Natrinema salifodinae]SEV82266.1 PAS domain S-box-containing protein [Natrinema salifodinae]